MKIWFFHQHAGTPSQIGAYTRHFYIARQLIAQGHDVTIIASSFAHKVRKDLRLADGETSRYQVEDGIPFLWLKAPAYGTGNIKRLWNLIAFGSRIGTEKELKKLPKPDIILGSSPSPFTAYAAMKLAQRFDVPFALEVRDLWPETLIELGGMSRRNPLVTLLARRERHMFADAAVIISALPNLKGYIKEFGLPDNSVVWIPNGIDLANVPDIVPPPDSDYFDIVYAGAHGIANGLNTVIEAAQLLRNRPEIRFRMIGDGPHKQRLIDEVKARGLRNVLFEDAVPHNEVFDKLASAHAFIANILNKKLYRFGVSLNKYFDYMAMARPTIVAVSAYNDPISEAGAGISIEATLDGADMARAIEKIADMSADERWQMGQRGRAYVEANHSFEVLAKKLEAALAKAVDTYQPKK